MKSQIDRVTELVIQRGGANADDLLPLLPDMTRKQVIKALQNAALQARLVSSGREYSSNGLMLATYTAPEREDDSPRRPNVARGPQIAYPSVFHFGQMQGVKLTWNTTGQAL